MNEKSSTSISIILPAFNEAKQLEKTVKTIYREMKKIQPKFEIIIAEDGSTDGTDKIAASLSKRYKKIRHFHNRERFGRGRALNRAFKKSKGKIMVYMDVDLATDLKSLRRLIREIKDGADVSTGSRYTEGSESRRAFKRLVASKVFNTLVKIFLGSKIKDHQCGFKAFKRKTILPLLDEIESPHWFWDTEILVKAQKKGLVVTEIPVKWKESKMTKVSLTNDIIGMGSKIFKLWIKSVFHE